MHIAPGVPDPDPLWGGGSSFPSLLPPRSFVFLLRSLRPPPQSTCKPCPALGGTPIPPATTHPLVFTQALEWPQAPAKGCPPAPECQWATHKFGDMGTTTPRSVSAPLAAAAPTPLHRAQVVQYMSAPRMKEGGEALPAGLPTLLHIGCFPPL